MCTYHVLAVIYPVHKEDVPCLVNENAPIFLVGDKYYEIKRVYIDQREERRAGVLRVIASNAVDARVLYESQALGVVFVKQTKQVELLLFSKETKGLSDANFVS